MSFDDCLNVLTVMNKDVVGKIVIIAINLYVENLSWYPNR